MPNHAPKKPTKPAAKPSAAAPPPSLGDVPEWQCHQLHTLAATIRLTNVIRRQATDERADYARISGMLLQACLPFDTGKEDTSPVAAAVGELTVTLSNLIGDPTASWISRAKLLDDTLRALSKTIGPAYGPLV